MLRRHGFTLVEMIVAVFLVAILTALIFPTVKGRMTSAYEAALIQQLQSLSTGIVAYHQDVGKWPPSLGYLSAMPPLSGLFRAKDLCGNNITAAQAAKYRGPYVSSQWPDDSVFANQDTIEASLTIGTGNTYLAITVNGPDNTRANDIDIAVDGTASNTVGTIQYSPRGNGNALLWIIPIRPGAC